MCLWFVKIHGPQLIRTRTVWHTSTIDTNVVATTATVSTMSYTSFITISWARTKSHLCVWWGWKNVNHVCPWRKWGSRSNPHNDSILPERPRPYDSNELKQRSKSSTSVSPSVVAATTTQISDPPLRVSDMIEHTRVHLVSACEYLHPPCVFISFKFPHAGV